MTVMIVRAMPPRWRGFLLSVALEVSPGVFVSPRMKASVRERVWSTAQDWFPHQEGGSFVMIWNVGRSVSHLALGEPPRILSTLDGIPVSTLTCKTTGNNNLSVGSLTIES